ncbi:30S ribosomal protein S16 [Candidatus Tremblaya phenacola]|uniref:Small ribosomal subunit protein bS16 n=1 Tax=Candidatus Tremblayella phenacoccinincola TaxID=1010676 RepID=A0A2G0V770_9PROT|nr:30S ribosomal protein S16 [Candidatus Tremblaya phenacola]PHN16307.1 30S ribosomal protein S16 [Candidatus Tremblaya phenacola]
MLTIRFTRRGARNIPFYNIVVADSRSKRDGKFIEKIGFYEPINKAIMVDTERLGFWVSSGALASCAVLKVIKRLRVKHGSQLGNNND